jgi:hypothetical protein
MQLWCRDREPSREGADQIAPASACLKAESASIRPSGKEAHTFRAVVVGIIFRAVDSVKSPMIIRQSIISVMAALAHESQRSSQHRPEPSNQPIQPNLPFLRARLPWKRKWREIRGKEK